MQIQHISSETKKLIARLNPIYNSFSEMTPSEQEFLTDIVRQYKPKQLLELGIASGSSSVLLLNAIQDIPDSHLTSIDYSTPYYRDKTKNSGFVVDEYPELKKKWTLYTGGMASEFMDKIGGEIDFCFIDTMHALPGEVIDFLLIFPYLKPDAVVVFHDTNLQTWGNWPQCTSNNMLVSAISGEKIIPETFENIFFHNTLKTDFQMYFPNITGIILDGTQKDRIWDIFNILTQKWKYQLKSEDVVSIKSALKKHYSDFYVKMFDNILNYQMNMAKNDKTIQDIIKENKELIDKRLQEEANTLQISSEEQKNLIAKNIENVSQQTKSSLDNILQSLSEKMASKTDVSVSVENVQQKIEQILKWQNASYISESKQNFNDLKSHQDERLSEISSIIAETSSLLLNKYQQLEDTHQKILSAQQENFDLHIQKLDKNFGILNQELNNEIMLSNQNIEVLTQKFLSVQQSFEDKQNALSKVVNELKMHVNSATVKKKYWYYKLMRWYPFPTLRKKYKQKYKEVKQLYKKIRKMKYEL